jgi:hypothetical protein
MLQHRHRGPPDPTVSQEQRAPPTAAASTEAARRGVPSRSGAGRRRPPPRRFATASSQRHQVLAPRRWRCSGCSSRGGAASPAAPPGGQAPSPAHGTSTWRRRSPSSSSECPAIDQDLGPVREHHRGVELPRDAHLDARAGAAAAWSGTAARQSTRSGRRARAGEPSYDRGLRRALGAIARSGPGRSASGRSVDRSRRVIRSATATPVAGACCTPCPEKPAACTSHGAFTSTPIDRQVVGGDLVVPHPARAAVQSRRAGGTGTAAAPPPASVSSHAQSIASCSPGTAHRGWSGRR